MCHPCLSLISKLNDWEGPTPAGCQCKGVVHTHIYIYNYTYIHTYTLRLVFFSILDIIILSANVKDFLFSHLLHLTFGPTYIYLGFILLYTGIRAMQIIIKSNLELYIFFCGIVIIFHSTDICFLSNIMSTYKMHILIICMLHLYPYFSLVVKLSPF